MRYIEMLCTNHMNLKPILEEHFYYDGRGPELQVVVWGRSGIVLAGFEYFNPHDTYVESNIKNIRLIDVEALAVSSDEVHGSIVANAESSAAIHEIEESEWKMTFQQNHLTECKHFQIMFYDEIYDVICKAIVPGFGRLVVE